MGRRGTRPNPTVPEPALKLPDVHPKTRGKTPDQQRHTELCMLAARWLMRGGRTDKIHCSTVAVEPFSLNVTEQPDVFGWNYWTTVIIEVKTSRADFKADFNKQFRQTPTDGCGEHRFYCCPAGLIREDEIPDGWGLLYDNNGRIEAIRHASRQSANSRAEFHLLASIARKFGMKPQLYQCSKRSEGQYATGDE